MAYRERTGNKADIILVGVSRSGKTPTCLYLALQYGIFAANYPLIPEDFSYRRLPAELEIYAPSCLALPPILYGCTRYVTNVSRTANTHLLRTANMKYAKPKR